MPLKRVRKPSQRAASTALRVNKPTNNAVRAPVIEGLIGVAARALVYAAELPDEPAEPTVAVEATRPVEIPDEPDVQKE
jgi:hypothetical protein